MGSIFAGPQNSFTGRDKLGGVGVNAQAQAEHAAKQSQLAMKTLSSVIDDIQSQLVNVPAAHGVRSRLLEESIRRLHDVAESLETAPEANRYLAEAHLQLGLIFLSIGDSGRDSSLDAAAKQFQLAHQMGNSQEALKHHKTALDLQQQAVDTADGEASYFENALAFAHDNMGDARLAMGDPVSAQKHYETSFRLAGILAERHPAEKGPDARQITG